MNVNQLLNMAIRMVMNQLIRRGMNKGIDLATRKRPRKAAAPEHDRPMPPEPPRERGGPWQG